MYGFHTGTLLVDLIQPDDVTQLWTRSGEQGGPSDWMKAQIEVNFETVSSVNIFSVALFFLNY